MKRAPKLVFALLAAVVCVLLFVLLLMRGDSGAFPPLPSPNGYDDFITAGNFLSGQTNDAYEMDVEQLRAFVAANRESLRLLQLGLTRTCSVHTVEFLTNNPALASDAMATKRLAQFEAAVGRLAELEGRTNDAVTAYLTGMRFGNEASRGGFVIHRLVGIACEVIARSRLGPVATNLSAADTRRVIRALEKLESDTVSWEEIDGSERMYMRGAIRQFNNPILLVQSWWSARSMLKKARIRHLGEIARRRLLIVELALRCRASEHGSPPQQLNDLVPEYLARVPLDPFTDQELIYRTAGTNWSLYSVGANYVDDGGAPATRASGGKPPGGDLRFDSR